MKSNSSPTSPARKLREFAADDQPFSLVVSLWGPHQPYYPSAEYADMVDPASIPEYPSFRDDLAGRPFRHLYHRDISHGSAPPSPNGRPGKRSSPAATPKVIRRTPRSEMCSIRSMSCR